MITADMQTVAGGAPIFLGRDDQDCQRLARSLSNILNAMAHSLENGTYIIVAH
ncbi:MAG: capping complex subunit for YIEGIA [Bacillota bacterium]